jgi:hypothetical protein
MQSPLTNAPYVQKLLEAFGVRGTVILEGDGWAASCPCPGHGADGRDTRPSVRITIGEGGRVLVKCRVGCETEDVLRCVGLKMSDLYPQGGDEPAAPLARGSGHRQHAAPLARQPHRPVDRHEYDFRHQVYAGLLQEMSLYSSDQKYLEKRGLSQSAIARSCFRSLTLSRSCRALRILREKWGRKLLTVPGIVEQGSTYKLQGNCNGGILFPVEDCDHRYVALKVRHHTGKTRYRLLSSDQAPAHNHCHVPPHGADEAFHTVRVTEGEIKALVATEKSEVFTIGVPGVNHWESALPALGGVAAICVLVAFDAPDVVTKPVVRAQVRALLAALRKARYHRVGIETWDYDGRICEPKGIDDALLAGKEIVVRWGDEADAFLDGCDRKSAELADNSRTDLAANSDAPSDGPHSTCDEVGEFAELADAGEEFPVHVYPEQLRRFVEEQAEDLGCDLAIVAAPVLAVGGAAMGSLWELTVKGDGECGWQEQANVWVGTIAQPGSAKTPAQNIITKPLVKVDEQRWFSWKDELKAWKRQKVEERGDRPSWLRALVTDTTVEGLAHILADNRRGLLIYPDELVGLARGFDQYKGGKGNDRQFFLKFWSRQTVSLGRASSNPEDQIYVPEPYGCILGSLPPDMLGELADHQSREDGFLDRFLFTYSPSCVVPHWSENSGMADGYRAWDEAVNALCGRTEKLGLRFSDVAKAAWVRFYNAHADEMNNETLPAPFRNYLSKLRTYAARLALILHGLRVAYGVADAGVTEVGAACVEDAWALAGYFKGQFVRATTRMREAQITEGVELLQDVITKHRGTLERGFTASSLWKLTRDKAERGKARFKQMKDFMYPFHDLCRRGRVVKEGDGGPRRPGPRTTRYRLAPANGLGASANSANPHPNA